MNTLLRQLARCGLPLLVLLLPAATARASVTLPLEVMGNPGATQTVNLYRLPRPATTLTLTVHGLETEAEGSVQVDNGPWIPLTNKTCAVSEPGKSFGGIGGGYNVLTLSLPVNVSHRFLQLTFRVNTTDGVNFGYRVLALSLKDAQGQNVLPPGTFSQHDPATETPPLNDAADIAAGKDAWQNAPLVQSPLVHANLGVHCADCHTTDGRDLKYFGYTNNTIVKRAEYHELSHQQALQIASYIRSLPVPVAGRPWNPPYQPGPGLDAKPLPLWAAGAGLGAVLARDEDMLAPLMANDFSAASTLNMRELPVDIPLPDWNHWLPRIHPKDAFGAQFTGSDLNSQYVQIRAKLSDPAAAPAFIADAPYGLRASLAGWQFQGQVFNTAVLPAMQADKWVGLDGEKVESVALWQNVKTWEIMQEFGLEDKAPLIYGKGAEPRSWLNGVVFYAAPFMQHIPPTASLTSTDIGPLRHEYDDNAWYALQVVLNAGNRHREGWKPVDWAYLDGHIKDLANLTHRPEALRMTAMYIKGMQQSDVIGAVTQSQGWSPRWVANLADLTWDDPNYGFGNVNADQYDPDPVKSRAVRVRILSAVLGAWHDKMAQYTPQAYYDAGFASPTDIPQGDANLLGSTYYFLRDMKTLGASPSNLAFMAAWAQSVWPAADWSGFLP